MTAAVTGIGLLISAFTGYFAPGFLYLAGVVGLGFFIRSRWAMLMAAALSALLWNLLFIPPVMTFKIERLEDALMCLFFFLVALSTGRLTSRLRVREQEEREPGKKDECPVPVFAGHWVRLGRAFPDFRRRRADQPDHGGAPGGHDAGRQRPQAEALGIRGGFFHG